MIKLGGDAYLFPFFDPFFAMESLRLSKEDSEGASGALGERGTDEFIVGLRLVLIENILIIKLRPSGNN